MQGLMGHSRRNMEDNDTSGYLNCEDPAPEDSEGHISMEPRKQSCDILTKDTDAFCFCVKNSLRLNRRVMH